MSDHQKMLQHWRNLFVCSELRNSCLFFIEIVKTEYYQREKMKIKTSLIIMIKI